MSQLDVRLTALSKLVDIKSAAVDQRLSEEFSRIEGIFQNSNDYDELSDALKTLSVLVPRFHMATLPLLETFVRSLPNRALTESGAPISSARHRYRSNDSLLRETIDVVGNLRFLHTEQVVSFLLEIARASDKDVKAKAEGVLEALATFDLDVFYGDRALGAEPQARMVAYFVGLQNDELLANANIILRVLSTVLSPSMEGHSWSYDSVTIRRGSIGSGGGIATLRSEAIILAKRMYSLDTSVEHRQHALQTLVSATRRETPTSDEETSAMFERDAIVVLEFMRKLVATEALPLIQKIEHQSYWIYFHGATPATKNKALEIRDAVDAHAEYQIYKQLIGFEGIFGKWEDLSRSEAAWDYSDNKRREAARIYLEEIDDTSYTTWFNRILNFSRTRSNDLATFPIYYDFLKSIGENHPRFALDLLSNHEELMKPFLIALLNGLWANANQSDVESLVKCWVVNGRNLASIARSLYQVGTSRLDVLASVVERATELDDRDALVQAMSVAANLFVAGASDSKAIFMRSLREMSKRDDASWANNIWLNRDLLALIDMMEADERLELLATLTLLPELNYQAENLLYEIAKHDVQAVLDFLVGRLHHARALEKRTRQTGKNEADRFEAIPYQLNKLNEILARVPEALLAALRRDFDAESSTMFSYRGARIINSAFPEFNDPLETLLLKYIESGDELDIEFVLGILRTYDGSPKIQNICKAIIKTVPERSRTWNEVAAAFESTGIVRGEYGLVEAYESKVLKLSSWVNDGDERVRIFAEWLIGRLQSLIALERQRTDQNLALRKYQYGVDKDES
ncbi:hypothetical protein ACW9HW_04380 [Pseudomonas sp. SDO5532_S415]